MSILNVNQIQPVGSGQTITISASDITASSATITASSVTATTVTSSSTSTFSSGLNVTGGSVGIGTDNPTYALQVHNSSIPRIHLTNDTTGTTTSDGFQIYANGNDAIILNKENSVLQFGTNNTTRATITSGGNVEIANGNLVFSTSGTGIDFSATSDGSGTMSSELLDDYEEGTFTPTFTGSTTNPTITFLNQLGRYTKIGNVCYIEIRMVTSNVSGGSGELKISGLPFSQSPSSNLGGAFTKGFVYAWAQDPETFVTFGGDSTIYIYRNDSTNTIAQVSDLTSGAANNYLNISGSYITS